MTRPTQKRHERFFVEQAAMLLGKTWILEEDREHPDFIITEGDLTWLFWTKRCESIAWKGAGHGEEEVWRGADRDAASSD